MFKLIHYFHLILAIYFDSFAEKDNAKNFLYNTLAFTVGMSLASIFYRDLGSTFSKGVTIGSETLGINFIFEEPKEMMRQKKE